MVLVRRSAGVLPLVAGLALLGPPRVAATGAPHRHADAVHGGAPAPSAPGVRAAPRLFAYYSSGRPSSRADLVRPGSRLAVLAPNWFTMSTADLTVYSGSRSPLSTRPRDYTEILDAKRAAGFELWPVINATFTGPNGGRGPSADQAQLGDAAKRARIVAEVARVAAAYPMAEGLTLDDEGLWGGPAGASQKAAYTALVTDVAAMLHARGRKLAVYAPGRSCAEDVARCTTWSAESYDWAALAGAADLLTVAGYDRGVWAGSAPGPVTTSAGWQALLDYAASVSPRKVVPTVAAFGYEWPSGGAGGGVLAGAGELDARRIANGYASTVADGETTYTTPSGHVVWFENQDGAAARLRAAEGRGMAWWGMNTLGREQPELWSGLGG